MPRQKLMRKIDKLPTFKGFKPVGKAEDVVPVVIPEAGNVVHGLADELVDVIPDEDVCMTYGSVKKFRVHRALCFM